MKRMGTATHIDRYNSTQIRWSIECEAKKNLANKIRVTQTEYAKDTESKWTGENIYKEKKKIHTYTSE